MAELVDALDSKSCGSNTVRVQVPLRPPSNMGRTLFFAKMFTKSLEFSIINIKEGV